MPSRTGEAHRDGRRQWRNSVSSSISLRPAVFARHRDARRMNDVGLDAPRGEPARQPEAVVIEDPLFEDSQETAASVETKWDFRDIAVMKRNATKS